MHNCLVVHNVLIHGWPPGVELSLPLALFTLDHVNQFELVEFLMSLLTHNLVGSGKNYEQLYHFQCVLQVILLFHMLNRCIEIYETH